MYQDHNSSVASKRTFLLYILCAFQNEFNVKFATKKRSKQKIVDWNSNLTYVRAEFLSEKMNDGVVFCIYERRGLQPCCWVLSAE